MKHEIFQALGVPMPDTTRMDAATEMWERLFLDSAPWLDGTTKSCGIATAVAGECARLTVVELDTNTNHTRRAEYLMQQLQPMLQQLRPAMELACATGTMVFKPYPIGKRLAVDLVPVWRFFPVDFDQQRHITAAVFTDTVKLHRRYYTRLEYHRRTPTDYRVDNLAFVSDNPQHLGRACDLHEVAQWAELSPSVVLQYADGHAPERMLFALFRVPWGNHIDPESPMGVSVYSRAVNLIEEADRQYSRILWEYEGSELAVHASEGALRPNGRMPKIKQRLFRELRLDNGDRDLYQVFSPAIRDTSLFNGLNQLLRRIEFACNLAYGTLSDPQNVARTAEEIKSGRQRSFSAVCELQQTLDASLQELIAIMQIYCDLYRLAPHEEVDIRFVWGDGVQEDVAAEFERRRLMVEQGILKPEKLLAWYFHISEQQAAQFLPTASSIPNDIGKTASGNATS